jgi:hypothetical protein
MNEERRVEHPSPRRCLTIYMKIEYSRSLSICCHAAPLPRNLRICEFYEHETSFYEHEASLYEHEASLSSFVVPAPGMGVYAVCNVIS